MYKTYNTYITYTTHYARPPASAIDDRMCPSGPGESIPKVEPPLIPTERSRDGAGDGHPALTRPFVFGNQPLTI
jgi:hypothetical protein